MSTKVTRLAAVFLTVALLATGCSFPWTKQPAQQPVVSGNDTDVHSCLISAGYSWCESKHQCIISGEEDCPATSTTTPEQQYDTITYLVSKADETQYCNGGANDNSDAFRKTITDLAVSDIPKAGLSLDELVKETAILATNATGMCQTVVETLDFKVVNGVVRIPPISGWAGISIVMCSCKPRVEVNLLRIPGITKIIWQ